MIGRQSNWIETSGMCRFTNKALDSLRDKHAGKALDSLRDKHAELVCSALSSSRRDAVNLAQDFSPGTASGLNDLVP
jgi:hypothetical protein